MRSVERGRGIRCTIYAHVIESSSAKVENYVSGALRLEAHDDGARRGVARGERQPKIVADITEQGSTLCRELLRHPGAEQWVARRNICRGKDAAQRGG